MPPLTLQQALEQAIQHHRAGQLSQAEAIYRQVLAQFPDQPDAMHHLGLIAMQVGNDKVAVELIGKAVAQRPDVAEIRNHLGLALAGMRLFDQAISEFRAALELKPALAEAYFGLGNVFRQLGPLDEAREAYQSAVKLKPDYAWAHTNLGITLMDQRRFDESVLSLREALRIEPNQPDFLNNLGTALRAQGKLGEAVVTYRQALRYKPASSDYLSNLGSTLLEQGDLDAGIAALREAVRINPADHLSGNDLLYALHFDPKIDAKQLFEEHRQWNSRHAAPLKTQIRPHPNDRDPDRPLRIGYVSADLREHAVGWFFLPLLRAHDQKEFAVYCYSASQVEDHKTEQIRALSTAWRRFTILPDDQVAQMIRDDAIDILIDLSAHCAGNRMLVFARKPAPVQVTYLSYPSTTGLDAIDYRLSDPQLDPPGADESIYSETTIRLPRTYWCYEPAIDAPDPNTLPASMTAQVTFGCLNTFRKVSDLALTTWARVLRECPTASLLLHANEGEHRQCLLDRFSSDGIDPSRIRFVGYQSLADYFATYQQIDIGLDPFPYSGGTTTCDALWMGVPVITLAGRAAVHRSGVSILSNVGMPELIVDSTDDYVRLATELARDLIRLQEIRQSLRLKMRSSPLMDASQFARGVENAFRSMWQRWCESGSG